MKESVAIIGAGAAGCFAAVNILRASHNTSVEIYEAGARPLAKVAITGGGRCNITNTFRDIANIADAYPRGGNVMKRLLRQFSPEQTFQWWEESGVALTTQPDQCVFPKSQDAMQVVRTLVDEIERRGGHINTSSRVTNISHNEGFYTLTFANGHTATATRVVVTTGGSPKASGLAFLDGLAMSTVPPVPSLYGLNTTDEGLHALQGIVVPNVQLTLAGTKHKATGDLLLTHWGFSGPAMLRLSSYAARTLAEKGYVGDLCVNWIGGKSENEAQQWVESTMRTAAQKQVNNMRPEGLTTRLWEVLLQHAGIAPDTKWAALGKKNINKMIGVLTADVVRTSGRCAYREEFVTAGGVAMTEVSSQTLESKQHTGLYFAGEVLDVDAITGGFNLQAAWTMGWVVAQEIVRATKQ